MALRGIFVGTSGWTYPDWNGPFYPPEVKGTDRLAFYADRYDTVEVNASFYRVPTLSMVSSWNRRLPSDFHLVLKGTRLVTHRKRLHDCDDWLDFFLERSMPLERLKVLLWQLPPSMEKDLDRLKRFLGRLPTSVRHALEFRH